jgi:molybdopterin synthase catalytic subunit
MQITIRYFAAHREISGVQSEILDVPEASTLADVWQLLEQRYPALVPYRNRVLLAQNERFVPASTILTAGDVVAFIPPVSGGSSTPPFLVTNAPLDPAPMVELVGAPGIGAIVTFSGTVRDHFGERSTARLEYEAYSEMATAVLADIAADASQRFGLGNVAIHHRIGILEIGDVASDCGGGSRSPRTSLTRHCLDYGPHQRNCPYLEKRTLATAQTNGSDMNLTDPATNNQYKTAPHTVSVCGAVLITTITAKVFRNWDDRVGASSYCSTT